ncbi:F0F1 ATP synthase subunit A [Nocardioides carbamazepini]|uniref:F0F1 ATP synthase subunit A n=1 Tax=Nocardioides carbamazepini TaxID=2854259 RepID=UPI00214A45DC|nr:F0F1 ATP synthase subunit A [Nocardioides carbamazepini]MCR1781806.1 F0F1 ATP synthase subunit A [Nocardioides carbamazepini]
MTIAASATIAAEGGEGYHAPGPSLFELPGIAGSDVTKPMVLLFLAALLVFGFYYMASRKRALVPGKLQFAGEEAYGFVRNSVARDIIGGHDFQKFVPYLVTVFSFILVNNLFGTIPFIQFPTFSRAGMAYALAGLSWLVYNGVGVHKHGLVGYLKLQSVPSGVSPAMYPLLVPLEFFSNILVRPVTLALRLFCNLFAGHILLALFSTGGLYLIQHVGGIGYVAGPLAWVLAILVGFLEILVQVLQAYVFVLLNAMYIQGALADEH